MIVIGGIKFDVNEFGRVLEIIRNENPDTRPTIKEETMTDTEKARNFLTSLKFQFEESPHTVAHLEVAIVALREKAERENPQPLTLEQLKERVGQPVYRRWKNGHGVWEVIARITEATEEKSEVFVYFRHDDWFPEHFEWAEFYDHKPER